MVYEPFRTCDLADIGTKKGGAGVAHIFIERFEDAPPPTRAQTAGCDCNIVLECHTRKVQYLVRFGEEGKFLLSLSEEVTDRASAEFSGVQVALQREDEHATGPFLE